MTSKAKTGSTAASSGPSGAMSTSSSTSSLDWNAISHMMNQDQPLINHDKGDATSIERSRKIFTSLTQMKSERSGAKMSAASSVHMSKYHVSWCVSCISSIFILFASSVAVSMLVLMSVAVAVAVALLFKICSSLILISAITILLAWPIDICT